jgi:hypothetical protein
VTIMLAYVLVFIGIILITVVLLRLSINCR